MIIRKIGDGQCRKSSPGPLKIAAFAATIYIYIYITIYRVIPSVGGVFATTKTADRLRFAS